MTRKASEQTATDIARSHAGSKPGYELVGYGEVGIPYFDLRLTAEVLDRKGIDPFSEYVLRAAAADVVEVDDLERLLGLDARVLEATLVTLITSDHLRGSTDYNEVSITQMGEETLEESSRIQVRSRQIRIGFDPMLKEAVEPFGNYLPPKDLAEEGIRGAGLPSSLVPELHDLSPGEVERIVRSMGGGREQASDVLALSAMRRFRVYRPATAMAFRAEETADLVVDLAFAGEVSPPHSQALAEWGMKDKLIGSRAGRDRIADRMFGVSSAKVKPQASEVDTVAPFELPGRLEAALEHARERVIVTSPGLQAKILDAEFLERIEDCADRGVSVHIGWGYDERSQEASDRKSVSALQALASRRPNLNVRQLDRKTDNVLIHDSRSSISTDYRWLSHFGDAALNLGDQRGLEISSTEYVDRQADSLIAMLTTRPA